MKCYQINISSSESIKQNVEVIRNRGVRFDWVVANAAVGADHGVKVPSLEVAESTLKTNVDATIDFVKQFQPLLADNGRIIIVSSLMAQLNAHHEDIRKELSESSITEERILQMSREYVEAAKKEDMGIWSWSAYRTSKALISAWERFILP